MRNINSLGHALKLALITSTAIALAMSAPIYAQDQNDEEFEEDEFLEEVIITGSRIRNPNVVAASPVTTIGRDEIELAQTPNIESVFRDLPITIPGDGPSVNNGSAGQATLDLRGLGPERMLILMDGKRLAPYDVNGIVAVDVIPVIMIKRVDVVTGGASAVYGSDAMSGAVNFIMRDDFEGFEVDLGYSDTDSGEAVNGGGQNTTSISALFGTGFADGDGHIVFGGGRTQRGSVLLGQRTFGLFGVDSESGSGLGEPPPKPEPACSGNTDFTVAASSGAGSTTAIPGTLNLRSGNTYQFRDNMDLLPDQCALMNFNPFNYYQTPQDRWQATTIASYNLNDSVQFYARGTFSQQVVDTQIAPSGTFGQALLMPVANPFFNSQARETIVNDLNAGATTFLNSTNAAIALLKAKPDPTEDDLAAIIALEAALLADPFGFLAVGITDNNGDDIFDERDSFTSTARRRTIELGPRSGINDTNYSQYVIGMRGALPGNASNWHYDLSYQYGKSSFLQTTDGYTNLTNIQTGVNTVSADQCITPEGVITPPPCTPINIFGPQGSITEAQRDDGFFKAIAFRKRVATQQIYSASIDGNFDAVSLPWTESSLSVAVGFDHMDMKADSQPDECIKLAPASCQGGAGGNELPIIGEYSSDEWFVEAILPVVEDRAGFEYLNIEGGYRHANYDVQGSTESWKIGFSWEIIEGFRVRAMQQQAVRVANIGELFRPIVTGLDNAVFDPCSIGNPNPPAPGSELFNRCVTSGTGMLPTQVGTVADIISGQINTFAGTDPNNLPGPEQADTTTVGFVWEPQFGSLIATQFSVDYYNIKINDYIDQPTGQESLDLCYVIGDPAICSGIVRVGGSFGESQTGTPAWYTNFVANEAEGLDIILQTGWATGIGDFQVAFTGHQYFTNQFQTTTESAIVDCKGRYGTSCDPVPEWRHVLRFSWYLDNLTASVNWRHIGAMDAQEGEAEFLFEDFQSVKAYNYMDLTFGYTFRESARLSVLVRNVLDEDPPILGNDTGSTSFNSGNTFPSLYDTMGRIFYINLRLMF